MAANLSWQIPLSDVNNTFAVTLISDQVLTGVTLDDFIFRPVGESTIEANSVATLTNVAGTNNWRLDVTLTGTYDTDFVVRLRPNRVTDADGDSNARLDSNAFRVDSSLTAPDAPTNLSINPSETTAAGSFDASANDGGLAVSDHEYAIEAGSSLSASPTWVSTGSTSTTFTIPSLVADTEYTAAVRAVNSIGESDASDSVTFTTTAAATVVTGYQIQVYDKNYKTQSGTDGTLARTLTHAVSIRIERDLNIPEKITFQVPRKGDDADAIEIGKVVRVIDGTDVIASGIITGPIDKTRPLITVNVLGKAILLLYSILPWDFKLEGSTAEAQVRELLKNYRFFRQNTEDQFNDGTHDTTEVTSVAESTTETNYYVTLTQTGEDYNASGTFISQPILLTHDFFGDPTDITRLRYVALLGNDTDIEVEFRHSNNDTDDTPGDSDFSAWSTEYNTSSDSETQQQLGITGYSVTGDFRWIQVRFTLTTSDVTITPALQAFEVVAEYPSEISAGSISLAGDALDETFSFKSHLSAIQRIVAARNAEFRVTDDYELEIAERFGVTTPTVTYTVHDNCEVVRFQQQDRRLSTEIWSLGSAGSGLTQPFETSASESATEAYGSRPWIYTPNATTEIARTQEIADELALRDTPTNAVVIEETDTVEDIAVGDLVSFEYTERSIDTTLRVIAITVADPRLGTPRQIELISDEGFFASQADAISGVTAPVTEGTTGTDAEDLDILEWYWFQPVDVNSNSSGEFSGVVLPGVEGNLNNPSGATVTLTVASRSSSLTSASINANGDLVIAFTGLAGNLAASVTIEAAATIGGVARTVPADIDLNLIYPPDAESVTEGDISAFGFITAGDPAIPDVSDFITAGDVPSTMGFITAGDIPAGPDLSTYVTTGDLTTATMGFITIGDVPDAADTSSFLTSGDLPDVSDFITAGDIPSTAEFITIGDVPVTTGDIPSTAGYITAGDPAIPDVSAFITSGDVPSTMGFITAGDPAIPDVSDFITAGDVPSTAGFITAGDIPAAPDLSTYVTDGDLPDVSSFITAGDVPAAPDVSDFITAGDPAIPDVSDFITAGDVPSTMGFITAGDIPAGPDLSTYVTTGDLTTATMGFITAGDVPDAADTSLFLTSGDLPDVSAFITLGDVTGLGYITTGDLPDVSAYITIGAVTGLGYITTGDLTAATASSVTTGDLTAATMALVSAGDLTAATMALVSAGDLTAATMALVSAGDLTAATMALVSAGDLTAATASSVTTGDLTAATMALVSAGDLTAATMALVSAGDLTAATASSVTTGDLTAATMALVSAGDLTAATASSVTTGDLTAATASSVTTGDLTAATASSVTTGDLPDVSAYITIGDVPVTAGDIPSTAGFITIGDVPVTTGDLPSTAGFITIGDVPVTTGDIPDVSDFITAGSSAIPDVSDFITAGDSAIPDVSDFVTDGDIPDVSDFVTAGDVPSTAGFVTEGEIPDVSDFITAGAIPSTSGFITIGEVTGLSYVTIGAVVANEMIVTESELDSYITTGGDIPVTFGAVSGFFGTGVDYVTFLVDADTQKIELDNTTLNTIIAAFSVRIAALENA